MKRLGILKNLLNVNRHLADENFVKRASPEVVERERNNARELTENQAKLLAMRERFASALQDGE